MQFGTDRDIYKTLGYPLTLNYDDYAVRYLRQDIAAAVINRPINATWTGPVTVTEVGDEERLQNAWKDLDKTLRLKSMFKRLDVLSSLGGYAVLLLGFNDVTNADGWKQPVRGNRKLVYVKPYSKKHAVIDSYDKNTRSKRYGLPIYYSITNQIGENASNLVVHHSRVLHVTTELMENDVEGIPVLQRVFNRLMDLEKIVGGSAEMFWRGARPGYATIADKDYEIGAGTKEAIQEQITEYEHDLRRILTMEGMDIKALQQQLADPANYVDAQIQMISAITGIPKRILTGSERGELASKDDKTTWNSLIKTRREEYAEDNIVMPFVQRMMDAGVLPKVKDWMVEWEDLFALSMKEQVEIGRDRAQSVKDFAANPVATDIVPLETFYSEVLGFTDDEIEKIKELREQQQLELEEEERLTEEEQEITQEERQEEE
jgi:hypothetical protein